MRAIRTMTVLIAAATLLAGCGTDEAVQEDPTTTSAAAPAATESAMPMEDSDRHDHTDHGDAAHAHEHSDGHEVPEGTLPPTLAAEVAWSPLGGWDLHLAVTHFRLAPERVSTEHIAGEGHAHVYVDGEKVGRVYGHAFHLGHLLPGEREVRVELSANDHAPVIVDGHPVEVVVTVFVTGEETPKGPLVAPSIEADAPHPAVSLEIVDDPAGGWNLHVLVENFRIGSAADKTADGFVVMRIGDQATRIYASWHQLPGDLPPGEHEISVHLHDRQARTITVDGEPVATSAVLDVGHS